MSSYPPGCHSVPGDEPEWCEVCGQSIDSVDANECICPECPVCGEYGDPDCYTEINGVQHMQESVKQRDSKAKMEQKWEDDCRAEWEAQEAYEMSKMLEFDAWPEEDINF